MIGIDLQFKAHIQGIFTVGIAIEGEVALVLHGVVSIDVGAVVIAAIITVPTPINFGQAIFVTEAVSAVIAAVAFTIIAGVAVVPIRVCGVICICRADGTTTDIAGGGAVFTVVVFIDANRRLTPNDTTAVGAESEVGIEVCFAESNGYGLVFIVLVMDNHGLMSFLF
jgi:hypothetical protein